MASAPSISAALLETRTRGNVRTRAAVASLSRLATRPNFGRLPPVPGVLPPYEAGIEFTRRETMLSGVASLQYSKLYDQEMAVAEKVRDEARSPDEREQLPEIAELRDSDGDQSEAGKCSSYTQRDPGCPDWLASKQQKFVPKRHHPRRVILRVSGSAAPRLPPRLPLSARRPVRIPTASVPRHTHRGNQRPLRAPTEAAHAIR